MNRTLRTPKETVKLFLHFMLIMPPILDKQKHIHYSTKDALVIDTSNMHIAIDLKPLHYMHRTARMSLRCPYTCTIICSTYILRSKSQSNYNPILCNFR